MKRIISLLLGLLFAALSAYAIAIVPPVVYAATVSVAALVGNLIIGLFVWLAASKLFLKDRFGKRPHELVRLFFRIASTFIIIGLSSGIAIYFIKPIALTDALFMGAVAAVIAFAVKFLASYWELRISKHRSKIVLHLIMFSLFVFLISSVSGYFSIKPEAIYGDQSHQPEEKFSIGDIVSKAQAPAMADEAEMGLAPIDAAKSGWRIWMIPLDDSECTLQYDGKTIQIEPRYECFMQNREKTFCPILIGDYIEGKLPSDIKSECRYDYFIEK